MASKIRLPDQEVIMNPEDVKLACRDSYLSFLDNIERSIHIESLEKSINHFENESAKVRHGIEKFLKNLHAHSVLAAFLIWTKQNYIGKGFSDYARKLFDRKVIKFTDSKNQLLLIENLDRKVLEDTIDGIRIQRNVALLEKEMLVTYYLDFMRWLRSTAFLYNLSIIDPDKQKTASRLLDYDVYIRLLTMLDERCQLVAKLLFFGGSRTLAEVLNVGIADIDFQNRIVRYDKIDAPYPLHVFEDIKIMVDGRKKGMIFLGRNKTPLNPATIFRNFKEAALKIGLNDDFVPKMLTSDI